MEDLENLVSNISKSIEGEFNTTIKSSGFISKESSFFNDAVLRTSTRYNADFAFYFVIPIDEERNIVTNDYYSVVEVFRRAAPNNPLYDRYYMKFENYQFRRLDELIRNLSNKIQTNVYTIEELKISNNEKLVPNSKDILSLEYKTILFYING